MEREQTTIRLPVDLKEQIPVSYTHLADMSDAFYQLGASSTATSNISMRYIFDSRKILTSSLQGCIDDSNSKENMLVVGHRQWMLNPKLLYTGFGYARNAEGYDFAVYHH